MKILEVLGIEQEACSNFIILGQAEIMNEFHTLTKRIPVWQITGYLHPFSSQPVGREAGKMNLHALMFINLTYFCMKHA